MITRIEKILSLLQAEGINPHNELMAIKSLSETVMPKQNIAVYKEWLSDKTNASATPKH